MATITRTVLSGQENCMYVTIDSVVVVPECVTRFSPGARVEVRKVSNGAYAVKAPDTDSMCIFSEEAWRQSV